MSGGCGRDVSIETYLQPQRDPDWVAAHLAAVHSLRAAALVRAAALHCSAREREPSQPLVCALKKGALGARP
jgi:hypothetical protein